MTDHVASEREPVSVIVDTDMGNDVDDALALGMLFALERRGECAVLAATLTKDHPKAAAFTDVIATFHGRGDLPIGVVVDGVTRDEGRFNGIADDVEHYPHELLSGADAPEAVGLLRTVLASQPDASVVIVQIGFSTNLARLLATEGDEHSSLSGRDLVAQKVRLLSLMAGSFAPIEGHDRFREYNVEQDIASARILAQQWPTPMWWSGFEIGLALPYPHQSIENDFDGVAHHPVKEAYVRYEPPPHDRPTWDLTSALVAVRPDAGYFQLSEPGRVVVDDDGFTQFVPDAEGLSRHLVLDPDRRGDVLATFIELSSELPPGVASGSVE